MPADGTSVFHFSPMIETITMKNMIFGTWEYIYSVIYIDTHVTYCAVSSYIQYIGSSGTFLRDID